MEKVYANSNNTHNIFVKKFEEDGVYAVLCLPSESWKTIFNRKTYQN